MSSLIPKISIGRDTKKGSHFDVSSMTHTTSEIGYVQPTFSKVLVPKTKVRIGTRTGVRLSPLFVPTMGKIDVRHYHVFAPFNTLWFPFDAFLTQTNYTLPSGETYVPSVCPHFSVGELLDFIFGETVGSLLDTSLVNLRNDLICSIYKFNTTTKKYETISNTEALTLDASVFNATDFWYAPKVIAQPDSSNNLVHLSCSAASPSGTITAQPDNLWLVDKPIPTPQACDFCHDVTFTSSSKASQNYLVCYNFSGGLKRIRTIFLGLGYSFNPFDKEYVTPFKLLGFYKAYWMLFGVNRSFNFFNTNCYKVIKYMSDHVVTTIDHDDSVIQLFTLLARFVGDMRDLTYTCPVDYFSSADTITDRGAGSGVSISTKIEGNESVGYADASDYQNGTVEYSAYGGNVSALATKVAMRLLRFVNKNSVVGRQISEILRTRYGVTDIHNTTHEDVIELGASACPIEISAVYNNTDSGDMPLGSYAGLGVGSRRSKMFTYSSDSFGALITLTAVVPKMGYFQGMLKENSDGVSGNFDFYTPEFDAIGWQSVDYKELVADRQHRFSSSAGVPPVGTDLGIWGYQPFYSHLKVGFNRVLADISLPHLRESMLPYTLDRYFRDVSENGERGDLGLATEYLPANDPQTFRSGTQGNTNRIFSDVSPTDDHIIMQIFFDVKMTAPMKSIATSYDTWDEESTHSVDVAHE